MQLWVVWAFFCIAFLWDWNENRPFESCGHCWVFQICWHIECSTFTASFSKIWNSSIGIPSPPLALFVVMLSRPTWLHIPGCLALGEWWHHRDYLGCEDLFCIVLLCIFATKSRDITFPTKVHLVKAMVFPVVLYGCESWTVKKAEHWRIDAFELWCWRRLLRVPWTVRRLNQSILKEISTGISLEGMMLKLKLQYFGHFMRWSDSLKKALMPEGLGAGGSGDDRGWDGWMASLTRCTWVWVNSGSWYREAWCAAIHGVAKSRTRLSHWTELNWTECYVNFCCTTKWIS